MHPADGMAATLSTPTETVRLCASKVGAASPIHRAFAVLWYQIAHLIMVHNVKDLSPDQRLAIESLLGRALRDEESLTIRPTRVLKDSPSGAERIGLFRQYFDHLDALAGRVKDVPEAEIDAAIDEAMQHVRRQAG